MPEQRADRPGSNNPRRAGEAAAGVDVEPFSAQAPPERTANTTAGESELLPPYRSRAVAFVIDHALFAVVFILALALGKLPDLPTWALVAVVVIGWIYYLGVTAWLMDGQTAGKVISGLRVRRVSADPVPHTPGGVAWSVGRHTVGYVITDVFLVGAWLALTNPRRRCLHDYAFGSEVSLDSGAEMPQGSFLERYRAYWERFLGRYDELNERNRWFFGPWKWLTKALIIIGVAVQLMLNGLGIAQASPVAAPEAAAKPLGLKATAALWAATTVSTGIVAASAAPDADPITSLNVVTSWQTVGLPATSEIHLMNADGSNDQQLTSNAFWDDYPDLFADRRVVFASDRDGNREIYVMNTDGSEQTRLTTNAGEDFCPSWSPDGTRIAFTSDRDGNREIYVMYADGSNQRRVTTEPADDQCPDWSPDGDRIVFTSGRDGNAELYTAQIDGSQTQRITNSPAAERRGTWSPDGDRIAFSSDRDGDWNIFVTDADDAGTALRVTDDPARDDTPYRAPDADALIFRSERGLGWSGADEIYVIDLDGKNLRRLSSLNGCGADTSTCTLE